MFSQKEGKNQSKSYWMTDVGCLPRSEQCQHCLHIFLMTSESINLGRTVIKNTLKIQTFPPAHNCNIFLKHRATESQLNHILWSK